MLSDRIRWAGRHVVQSAIRTLRRGPQPELPAPDYLDPPETLHCAPAVFDPDTLSRVVSCGFGRSLESEVEKLRQTRFTTTPMRFHDLGEGAVIGGIVETASAGHWLGPVRPYKVLTKPVERFDTLYIANTLQGLAYFGHWLRDDCVAFERLRAYGTVRSLRRPAWPDCAAYEELFGQRWQEIDFAVADRIVLQRELGFNPDKARRIGILRARVRAALDAPNRGGIVYLERGRSGARRQIVNEDALTSALSAAGVQIVTPERGIAGTLPRLLDAEVLITVEGSQAAHGVFALADGGTLIVLQPPRRFYNPHHEWTRLLGMRYAIVVGEDTGEEAGFRVDPGEVLSMVDRLLAARL